MLTLGELRDCTCFNRHASPASIWFCCPGRSVRYICVSFTDWIWHLSSQHGWIPRPQHLLLRLRLSTLLTQASIPSAQRWSRGQYVCKTAQTCHVHQCVCIRLCITLHVCSVYLTGGHLAHAVAQNFNSSHEGPQCVHKHNSLSCSHMSSDCSRCIQMLAGLWNAPESGKTEGEQRLGTSTIGSSEACMLGGLALKRRWSVARKKAGKSTDKPNLILGINAQVSQPAVCTTLT